MLLLAFFLRFIKLDLLPLSGDETDVALQAQSLSINGRDYRGNFLPTYIQSFAESRAPLLMYFTVPSIKLFGVNTYSLRLIPLLFGILSIYLTYLLVIDLSKSPILSLGTAFSLTISPWHIHYSRMSYEVTLLISLILLGIIFFRRYLKRPRLLTQILFILFFLRAGLMMSIPI